MGEQTGLHAHHAVQITVPLSGGRLRFRVPGKDWVSFDAVLIPAHQSHAFDAPGQTVAHVFADPESRQGRVLHLRHRDLGPQRLEDEAVRRAAVVLAALLAGRTSDSDLIAAARALIAAAAAGGPEPEHSLDPRIEQAVRLVRAKLGETVRLAEIASSVHLSPERFRHLFLQQTGMRFRPFVLWARLERSLEAYSAGDSLTQAAYAGGFADSAHLSRTFRRMFGVAPGSLEIE